VSTQYRYDSEYLKKLLKKALAWHPEAEGQEEIRYIRIPDYFVCLTLDGLRNLEVAKKLVMEFHGLQSWLGKLKEEAEKVKMPVEEFDRWLGMLFILEELLSLKHGIACLPGAEISREDFTRSWKHIAKRLGLE
jgi:hypothetical protein